MNRQRGSVSRYALHSPDAALQTVISAFCRICEKSNMMNFDRAGKRDVDYFQTNDPSKRLTSSAQSVCLIFGVCIASQRFTFIFRAPRFLPIFSAVARRYRFEIGRRPLTGWMLRGFVSAVRPSGRDPCRFAA